MNILGQPLEVLDEDKNDEDENMRQTIGLHHIMMSGNKTTH